MEHIKVGHGQILVADGDTVTRLAVNQALARAGYSVRGTKDATTLCKWISQGDGDLVIADAIMPDVNALDLISRIKKIRPGLPIIVTSAQTTLMMAIRAAEGGAYEYFPKPFDVRKLVKVVERALRKRARVQPTANPESSAGNLGLVGRSAAMQTVYRVMARLTHTSLTVIITGESGTGKELVARTLHDCGDRREGPFVAINMAAIPDELIASELFGSEKGAAAGAGPTLIGRFEQARGGTLFLDEIGGMPIEAQARLLRLIQEGQHLAVSGRMPVKTDIRIIAATNKNLEDQIALGLFREDLYHRVNVVPLRMPALRERLEDIPDLVQHFLKIAEQSGFPPMTFTAEAFARLKRHNWPGNVRELENLVRRVAALYPAETIYADIIDQELRVEPKHTTLFPDSEAEFRQWTEAYLCRYFESFGGELPPPGLYHRIMREVEVPLISAALGATLGNQIKAAHLLGVNRNTLRRKLREQSELGGHPGCAARRRCRGSGQ
jgi:two-component system nitrogen regulation response regulator GlnG